MTDIVDRLTYGMSLIVKNKPVLYNRVTDIRKTSDWNLTVVVNGTQEYNYAHVISTAPLGALQAINTTELGLSYFQNTAIRTLKYVFPRIRRWHWIDLLNFAVNSYDPSTKIGFKFKTRW